jgi:hypothetical protein
VTHYLEPHRLVLCHEGSREGLRTVDKIYTGNIFIDYYCTSTKQLAKSDGRDQKVLLSFFRINSPRPGSACCLLPLARFAFVGLTL